MNAVDVAGYLRQLAENIERGTLIEFESDLQVGTKRLRWDDPGHIAKAWVEYRDTGKRTVDLHVSWHDIPEGA